MSMVALAKLKRSRKHKNNEQRFKMKDLFFYLKKGVFGYFIRLFKIKFFA